MDLDKVKDVENGIILFQDLSREERKDFLEYRKSLNNRVSIEELELEYELKSIFLLSTDRYDFAELYLEEFLQLIFIRESGRFDYDLDDDDKFEFEEIKSLEYQIWDEQQKRISQLKRKAERSGALPPSPFDYNTSLKIDYSGYTQFRYNPIIFYKEQVNGEMKNRHRLLLKNDEETMEFLRNRKFAIMSPVTYVGKSNSYVNARNLFAIAIDLDGVGVDDVEYLLVGMQENDIPVANIIVNSGHGIHVYYLLDRPIKMYKTRLDALNKLKKGLTNLIWRVSHLDKTQTQTVIQGFRLPGTQTKFKKPVRAFWNKNAPYHNPRELNQFLGSYALNETDLNIISNPYSYNPGNVTLETAKKNWPEWYEAKVINKKSLVWKWDVPRWVYDAWLKRLRDGKEVNLHHRYFCILSLIVYATKCNIPYDEVLNDALSLVPAFDKLTKTVDNPFTKQDVYDAMQAYGKEKYNIWTIEYISWITKLPIKRNKRNGRKQKAHLNRIRRLQEADYPNGEWRSGNGRKKGSVVAAESSSNAAKVINWQIANPGCNNKARCARETGLSRPTVHKWWT